MPRIKRKTPLKIESLELPSDFKLTEEFKNCFTELENTSNNFYVTGRAGTGKTSLLKYFRLNTKKNVVVLAPTGIAAINSYGQTAHSFFQLPPTFLQESHIEKIPWKRNLFSKIDTLVIDEVSMVRADLMDAVDKALRINTGRKYQAFGGVQIVLIGDLYQLPPVVTKDLEDVFEKVYETPYFFSANVFKQNGVLFHGRNLKEIHRQQDITFQSLLNKMRRNLLNESDLDLLNQRCLPESLESIKDCITLVPTNYAASVLNEARLAELNSKELVYTAMIEGDFDESSYPTAEMLKLKVGAQVLMIKNDDKGRWVNGNIGEVVYLGDDGIKVCINGATHDVLPVEWEKIRYALDNAGQIVEEVTGRFVQYPIKLAWAITIHKSQGLTFEKVIVDLDAGTFAHGQLYVAMSRCRTLEGLFLKRPVTCLDGICDGRLSDPKYHSSAITWDAK